MVNPKEQVKRPKQEDKEIMGEEDVTEVEFEQPIDKEDKRIETPEMRAPSPVKVTCHQFPSLKGYKKRSWTINLLNL